MKKCKKCLNCKWQSKRISLDFFGLQGKKQRDHIVCQNPENQKEASQQNCGHWDLLMKIFETCERHEYK